MKGDRRHLAVAEELTFMVQLWAAVMPGGPLSNTTHWLGGRASFMDAERKRWLMVSMPSSAVTYAWKYCCSPIRCAACINVTLQVKLAVWIASRQTGATEAAYMLILSGYTGFTDAA